MIVSKPSSYQDVALVIKTGGSEITFKTDSAPHTTAEPPFLTRFSLLVFFR